MNETKRRAKTEDEIDREIFNVNFWSFRTISGFNKKKKRRFFLNRKTEKKSYGDSI